ncbi:MAG: hypothetical protein KJ583_03915 [Nanoarchaeota archaeon]|nr:hypothetical protein [Nanoarchaeota archaeon]MBU1270192.1 hypothetical protein [Nanoarchaeota archaeon]MBU1604438.1 hypothetical protein [Nanoarchaeota archaeon]MBU2443558.1 hypothetical protein [Nanoarchaeota archaeon]
MAETNSTENKDTVYLVGSFFNFRSEMIQALPNVNFIDARKNRQSRMSATNEDDLYSAIHSPLTLAVFPKGKTPGVMTFVEIGASYFSGNDLIVVDECGLNMPFLKEISKEYLSSIDDAIDYMKSYNVPDKKPELFKENLNRIGTIYFCGNTDYGLQVVHELASKLRPDKEYIMKSENIMDDVKKIDKFDLMAVHFPKNIPIDRESCFMMGGAVARYIPIIEKAEDVFPYSPLVGGLQRRLVNDLLGMLYYIVNVDNASLFAQEGFPSEPEMMYGFFKKFGDKG